MPTKYAVRTSVLSNTWRHRFLAVPSIVIDEPSLFCHANRTPDGRTTYQKLDFIKFVNRRLVLSKTSSVTEFRLKCQEFPELPVIDLWIMNLFSGNITLLEIEQLQEFFIGPPLCPPPEIFSSGTLGVLKLNGPHIVLNIPESAFFPKLKVLHFKYLAILSKSDSLTFADDHDGYPLLEDLRFEATHVQTNKDIATLVISISTLKELEIINVGSCKIEIGSPRLQYLICKLGRDGLFGELRLRRCESIISADFYEAFDRLRGCLFYVRLLNMVSNVKELRISKGFSEISLGQYTSSLPKFPKLTDLELTANGETVWILLQRAPILKTLVYDMDCAGNSVLPVTEPMCLVSSLREIRVRSFKGAEAECAVVRYYLKHAEVLEKMTIELKGRGFHQLPFPTLKQLIEQRRVSPSCQIEFLEWSS